MVAAVAVRASSRARTVREETRITSAAFVEPTLEAGERRVARTRYAALACVTGVGDRAPGP
jgi:hypothetical protein